MLPIKRFLAKATRHRKRYGRPLVTLAYAQSLDGSIAARRGYPLTLSGRESLRLWHTLRAAHDAILVGIGTILADNPRLNVRLIRGKNPQPVILDSNLRFPIGSKTLNNNKLPWIFTTESADRERQRLLKTRGVTVIRVKTTSDCQVDLHELLHQLAHRRVNSLLVEGGARIITSFLNERLVDQFVITITPFIVGGLHGVEKLLCSHMIKKPAINYFPKIKNYQHHRLGQDLVVWGSVTWEDS
ncbi:MAG: RibD family protein [candidate division WOR-3 bacterium]|nr:MAG: RibD family protein [candidate division WOR-3 bacterium]